MTTKFQNTTAQRLSFANKLPIAMQNIHIYWYATRDVIKVNNGVDVSYIKQLVDSDFSALPQQTQMYLNEQSKFNTLIIGENDDLAYDFVYKPILDMYRQKAGIDNPLFSWNKIPGNDSGRLTDYLKLNYDVDWVKTAKIAKTDNDKTIMITAGKNFLSLKLNNDNTELNLQIDNGKTDKFIVKTKKGKLNIYQKAGGWGTKTKTLPPIRDDILKDLFEQAIKELGLKERQYLDLDDVIVKMKHIANEKRIQLPEDWEEGVREKTENIWTSNKRD